MGWVTGWVWVEGGWVVFIDPSCSALCSALSFCLRNMSKPASSQPTPVTCGFEAEVLMGLAAVSRVSPDEVKEEEMLFTLKVPTISDVMLTRLDVKCHNSHTPTPLLSSQDIDISCSGSQINSIIYLKSQPSNCSLQHDVVLAEMLRYTFVLMMLLLKIESL